MGNAGLLKIVLFIWLHLLTRYESADRAAIFTTKFESEELLDAFLAGEIPAIYDDNVNVYDWLWNEEDNSAYSVGERIDLDNDGENELIINGPYGGRYLDARNGKVYLFAQGEGTGGQLFFTHYDDAVWIVHCDITHAGRQMYWLTKYDGDGNVVDEFQFSAEYWGSRDNRYDENSDFTYRDKKYQWKSMRHWEKRFLDGETESGGCESN